MAVKFDFSIFLIEKGDQIEMTIEYSERFFSDEMVQQFVQHFSNVLTQVSENHESLIETIQLSSIKVKSETGNLELAKALIPDSKFEGIHNIFEQVVQNNPDNVCLRYNFVI